MKLKIDNKEYPLQWGMGALEMFCDALDCEITDLDKALNVGKEQIKYLTTLIYCAVKNGAEEDSYWGEFEVSYRRLQRYLDEATDNSLADIIEDFKRSKYFGKTIAEHIFNEVAETEDPENPASKKKLPSAE